MCSSHVFTNPEFSLCNYFLENKIVFPIKKNYSYIDILWSVMKIHLEQIKANDKFQWKSSGFVDSGFVKTCDELVVIGQRKIEP